MKNRKEQALDYVYSEMDNYGLLDFLNPMKHINKMALKRGIKKSQGNSLNVNLFSKPKGKDLPKGVSSSLNQKKSSASQVGKYKHKFKKRGGDLSTWGTITTSQG